MKDWLKALLSEGSITIWTILSAVSTLTTFFPSLPHRLRPATFVVALVSFAWANLKVFRKEREKSNALRQSLAAYEARVSKLVIEGDQGSRYILQPLDNVPGGGFRGGHFEFCLWIENVGTRNSIVAEYEVEIRDLHRTFRNLVPIENLTMVRGRYATMGINSARALSVTGNVEIRAESATRRGTLLFLLPEITLEDFAAAGFRMQGQERRFGDLRCLLTIHDRSGVSASHEFMLRED